MSGGNGNQAPAKPKDDAPKAPAKDDASKPAAKEGDGKGQTAKISPEMDLVHKQLAMLASVRACIKHLERGLPLQGSKQAKGALASIDEYETSLRALTGVVEEEGEADG